MDNRLYKLMNWPRIEGIVYSEEKKPSDILGPHVTGRSVLFQTFWPDAEEIHLVYDGKKKKMEMADESGYFACLLGGHMPKSYLYEIHLKDGTVLEKQDPYGFHEELTGEEAAKWNAGIDYCAFRTLGAHVITCNGTKGTWFAVFAPSAVRVSVVGPFNDFDGRVYPMDYDEQSGVFSLFIPGLLEGTTYQYEVKSKGGSVCRKADPFATQLSVNQGGLCVVSDSSYEWKDQEWQKNREKAQFASSPMSVYEVYLGSFQKSDNGKALGYKELAEMISSYVKEMGYTHIELMPVMEHIVDASWGYQTIGYFAPTARYGTPNDFKYFIDYMHREGIGVILDWVPMFFPRESYGLSSFDGTALYEHADPRRGYQPHVGAMIFDYGKPQISGYLLSNAVYWVEEFHADGLKLPDIDKMLYLDYGKKDGEWIPNIYGGNEDLQAIEFIKHLNSILHKRNPGICMIADEAGAWPQVTGAVTEGGLGFDLKWNRAFAEDALSYIGYDPYFRSHHHDELTLGMVYQYSENYLAGISHHHVVHGKSSMIGKMPGNKEDKFANLRLFYAYLMTHPGKKQLFMGQDLAQFTEFDETVETDFSLTKKAEHKGISQLVKDLNFLYRNKLALYELDTVSDGFEWINCMSSDACMLSYVRKGSTAEDMLLVVANFAGVEQTFSVGVPFAGKYKELFTTDDALYGGTGSRHVRAQRSEEIEADGREQSIKVKLSPLSLSIYSYIPFTQKELLEIEEKKEETRAKNRVLEAIALAKQYQEEAKELRRKAIDADHAACEAEEKARKAEDTVRKLQKEADRFSVKGKGKKS